MPFAGILLVMIFQVWIRDKYNYHTDYIRLYYPGYTLLEAKTTNNVVRRIINWYIKLSIFRSSKLIKIQINNSLSLIIVSLFVSKPRLLLTLKI